MGITNPNLPSESWLPAQSHRWVPGGLGDRLQPRAWHPGKERAL